LKSGNLGNHRLKRKKRGENIQGGREVVKNQADSRTRVRKKKTTIPVAKKLVTGRRGEKVSRGKRISNRARTRIGNKVPLAKEREKIQGGDRGKAHRLNQEKLFSGAIEVMSNSEVR